MSHCIPTRYKLRGNVTRGGSGMQGFEIKGRRESSEICCALCARRSHHFACRGLRCGGLTDCTPGVRVPELMTRELGINDMPSEYDLSRINTYLASIRQATRGPTTTTATTESTRTTRDARDECVMEKMYTCIKIRLSCHTWFHANANARDRKLKTSWCTKSGLMYPHPPFLPE